MKKFLLTLGILLCGIPSFAVTFNGFVADEAHILTPTMVEKINKQAQDLQNRTKAEIGRASCRERV